MCLWVVVKGVYLSKFTEELLNFFSSEVKSSQIRLERKCQRAFNAFCANSVLLPELLQSKHGNVYNEGCCCPVEDLCSLVSIQQI